MNKALKQWVDLFAEKETAFRNKTILTDEAKEGLKLSKNTKLKLILNSINKFNKYNYGSRKLQGR